jgi:hypothetical protein
VKVLVGVGLALGAGVSVCEACRDGAGVKVTSGRMEATAGGSVGASVDIKRIGAGEDKRVPGPQAASSARRADKTKPAQSNDAGWVRLGESMEVELYHSNYILQNSNKIVTN